VCAPGWTKDLFVFQVCSEFKKCTDTFKDNSTFWTTIGAHQVSVEGGVEIWELPKGWNNVDVLESELKSRAFWTHTREWQTDRHV
jgi:hypothetical protein